jgi:transcriptional regulator with XRE-family HTH domain
MTIFAQRLTGAFEKNNISKGAFAKKYGFKQKTVDGWCSGECEPQLKTVRLLRKELKVSLDYLLGLTDETAK